MSGPRRGVLRSINVSRGGLPKQPVLSARLDVEGVSGDRQADRRYHGGPDRAVTLFSQDRIDALRAEGHPIQPGTIGENLTVAGLDWTAIVPGTRVAVGEARVEVTEYAAPCRKIAGSFEGRDIGRVSQEARPGWSRVCARVLEPGTVQVGDEVTVESPRRRAAARRRKRGGAAR